MRVSLAWEFTFLHAAYSGASTSTLLYENNEEDSSSISLPVCTEPCLFPVPTSQEAHIGFIDGPAGRAARRTRGFPRPVLWLSLHRPASARRPPASRRASRHWRSRTRSASLPGR